MPFTTHFLWSISRDLGRDHWNLWDEQEMNIRGVLAWIIKSSAYHRRMCSRFVRETVIGMYMSGGLSAGWYGVISQTKVGHRYLFVGILFSSWVTTIWFGPPFDVESNALLAACLCEGGGREYLSALPGFQSLCQPASRPQLLSRSVGKKKILHNCMSHLTGSAATW
jgi:hypothetical protein